MRRILITGANRGIGCGLTQEYLRRGDVLVFAACRDPQHAEALQALARQYPGQISLLALDVTKRASIEAAIQKIGGQVEGLDILYNNAGIYPDGVFPQAASASSTFGALEAEAMLEVFQVNTVAPVIVTQVAADLLRKGTNARVINVSSDAGSITWRTYSGNYSYPGSKAALNMFTRGLAADFRADGVIVISLHPGWIRTDMGGDRAPLALEAAVPNIIERVEGLGLADSGEFVNWDGKRIPW